MVAGKAKKLGVSHDFFINKKIEQKPKNKSKNRQVSWLDRNFALAAKLSEWSQEAKSQP